MHHFFLEIFGFALKMLYLCSQYEEANCLALKNVESKATF